MMFVGARRLTLASKARAFPLGLGCWLCRVLPFWPDWCLIMCGRSYKHYFVQILFFSSYRNDFLTRERERERERKRETKRDKETTRKTNTRHRQKKKKKKGARKPPTPKEQKKRKK